MDTRGAPGWVSGDHPEDQISRFLRQSSPPCWLSDPGDEAPIETEACPMRSNHCLRRDHDQSFFPRRPEPMGNDPKEFVKAAKHRSRVATLQHSELLSEREVLQDGTPTATKHANERSEPEKKLIEYGPELHQKRGRTLQ
jgi:hypothetical protein